MAHLKYGQTRAEATPVEWLKVGSQVGRLVNDWAGRDNLVAYLGPNAGDGAPACYNPDLAEIEVNCKIAFGPSITPEQIGDMTVRATQFDWPRASGAILHEAMHARFSRYSLADAAKVLDQSEHKALCILEESRIEALAVTNFPHNRGFLRACAIDIVLADAREGVKSLSSTESAATLAALTLARIDADVLERSDVEVIADELELFLGEDLLKGLRSVWNRFQMHEQHSNPEPLYELAREWAKLVKDAAEERGEEPGQPSKEGQEFIQVLLDALQDAAEAASINAQEDLSEQQTSEEWAEQVQSKASASRERKDHEKEAQEVFTKGTGPLPGSRTSSRLHEKRMPTGPERAAAVKVAQILEKAKYRERDEHDIVSQLPPGKLKTRALVQGAALKSKGVVAKTEPWKRTVRKHTDDPTLTVGVMVDISGSMSSAMQPMAVTAWVMSEAAKRVQARCAMVYYGQDVFPTLRPGQSLSEINVYTAPDGTEKFNKAFKALDGSLNLLHGTGARLLVVVSDGCYTPEEIEKAKRWIRRCHETGVAVLWLPMGPRDYYAEDIIKGTDAVMLADVNDPAKAALEIGRAAGQALEKVTSRTAA
jgi:hypothetical protein